MLIASISACTPAASGVDTRLEDSPSEAAPATEVQPTPETQVQPTTTVTEASGPQPLWVYEFPGRTHTRPTVVDGVVYASRGGEFEGGSVLALTAETGSLVWEIETTGLVPASPLVQAGVVYIATLSGEIFAVRVDSGSEIWRHQFDGRLRSNHMLHQDLLILAGYRLGQDGGGTLFAISAETGAEVWQMSTDNYFFESSPTIAEQVLLIGNTDGNLYAVDPGTGELQWTVMVGDPTLRQHPLSNRREVLSTAAYADGVIYVSSNDGHVYAVNMADQSMAWRTSIDNSEGRSSIKYSISSPVVVGDRLYVGSNNGAIYAIERADGRIAWQYQTDSWVWSTPAFGDDMIFVGSDDRNLYALDSATGALIWAYDTGPGALDREALSGIWGDPTVSGDTVYVGAQNGTIHAVPIHP